MKFRTNATPSITIGQKAKCKSEFLILEAVRDTKKSVSFKTFSEFFFLNVLFERLKLHVAEIRVLKLEKDGI